MRPSRLVSSATPNAYSASRTIAASVDPAIAARIAYHPRVPRSLNILVAAALVLVAAPRAADAGKVRAVHIESEPPGAEVYLGDKEQGSRGQTPLDVELAPGEYVVIIELDGHVPAFQTLIVDDVRGKKATAPVTLKV